MNCLRGIALVRHYKKVHFPFKPQMKLEGKTMDDVTAVGCCSLTAMGFSS